jgi:hypothetical protein
MIKPQRIQLSRKKGFNLQEVSKALNGLEAVKVARPSKFGNPFVVGNSYSYRRNNEKLQSKICTKEDAIRWHKEFCALDKESIIKDLKGKNLACYCKLSDFCHADILLKIANEV